MYDRAIGDFNKAITLDSTDMASFIDRGLSNMEAGYIDNAKSDFNFVIANNSNKRMRENALYWLARIGYNTGDYKGAVANCNMYLLSRPNDPEVIFFRASAYSMLFDFEKSIDDYSRIIELSPSSYYAYANRGVAKINQLTGNGNLKPSKKETRSACKDLKKAKEMGDNTVDDMIYMYCDRKKKE